MYALGQTDANSPVLVTCNFKLTFDALRHELAGLSCWLLIVETYGINVWCAAGKQSFSTQEVAFRVKSTNLAQVVSHRNLVLPQLAAPAVAAHKLRKLCGFSGVFGPVRIQDLPTFLESDLQATQDMRKVQFPFSQRLIIALVEVYGARKFLLWTFVACLLLAVLGPGGFNLTGILGAGLGAFATALAGFATGVFLVPTLLAHIPFRAFAAKGLLAGAFIGLPAAWLLARSVPEGLAIILGCSAFASWFAMHYTGSTPFTSLSGVDQEMRRFMPLQGALLLVAVLLWLLWSWM